MVINTVGNNNSILRINTCQNSCLFQEKGIGYISKSKSGQFDTLVKSINSSISTKSNNVNTQSIKRSLNKLTNDEQLYMAKKAYEGMQLSLSSAIGTTEDRIESFKELMEERDYYKSLINDKSNTYECITKDEPNTNEIYKMTQNGNYRFSNLKAGDYVRINDIKSNIGYVNNALNNIVKMTHTDNCDAIRNYNVCAETFSSVFPQLASKYSSLFDTEKCSIIKDENLTVENFIEKSQKNIDAMKERSNNLAKMYKDESLKDLFKSINPSITIDSIQKHLQLIYEQEHNSFSCFA